MKQVFPEIRPRRLGTRGHSRYCYAALRKATSLMAPILPTLGGRAAAADKTAAPPMQRSNDVVDEQSCDVIRKWATSILNVDFAKTKDLADYITANQLTSSNSNRLRMNQHPKKTISKDTATTGSASAAVTADAVATAVALASATSIGGGDSSSGAARCQKEIKVSSKRKPS